MFICLSKAAIYSTKILILILPKKKNSELFFFAMFNILHPKFLIEIMKDKSHKLKHTFSFKRDLWFLKILRVSQKFVSGSHFKIFSDRLLQSWIRMWLLFSICSPFTTKGNIIGKNINFYHENYKQSSETLYLQLIKISKSMDNKKYF